VAKDKIAWVLAAWGWLSRWALGRWLFSRLLGWVVPYTGTVRARVELLQTGHCRVSLRDRRRVRNHLGSIHALALANLGEMASGLAMYSVLPANLRGIVTALSVEYLKKARGTLVAESRCALPQVSEPVEHVLESLVRDSAGDVVARCQVRWRLSPRPPADLMS
jgi:acyl-coenzyme A thioesterase PaaI-like protein